MNSDAFLRHHGLTANPFRAEEAREDSVFDRIESQCRHPDFHKILGDLEHASSSVVFGERGSGKTAIRLQIEQVLLQREEAGGAAHRIWLVAYDDFNDLISRFMQSLGDSDPDKALPKIKLVDHMDGILLRTVPQVMDGVFGERTEAPSFGKRSQIRKAFRLLTEETRRQLLRMQVCYDRPRSLAQRTRRLKRMLGLSGGSGIRTAKFASVALAILGLAEIITSWLYAARFGVDENLGFVPGAVLVVLAGYMAFRWFGIDWRVRRTAKRLQKGIRVDERSPDTFKDALAELRTTEWTAPELPVGDSDSTRFTFFLALVRMLRALGYESMMVLIDRLDEPTAINGDTRRMKSFIWPIFNNKFLQMPGVGFKLLLPLELRGEIMREREEFFREARLDKQHMIERLIWSGPMLYDLCNTRFRACLTADRRKQGEPSLMDLFSEEVYRQDLVDAIGELEQARDAFKFLYALIQEHCSNTTEEDGSFRITRPTLDLVRKRQVQRKEDMLRGQRPA